jgi:hypothetical protein
MASLKGAQPVSVPVTSDYLPIRRHQRGANTDFRIAHRLLHLASRVAEHTSEIPHSRITGTSTPGQWSMAQASIVMAQAVRNCRTSVMVQVYARFARA